MEKISAKKIFLAVLVILLVIIFGRFIVNLSFPEAGINLQKGAIIKLQPESSLQQKFTATREGLSKVEFLLRSPGIAFEKNDRVEVEMADETCQHSLRKGELKSPFLASDNLYEFNFEKMTDSKDKTFCLVATFKPTKSSAKAIQFFTLGEEVGQPLSLRPVYRNQNVWQNLNELDRRVSQYKPWFLKHYFLLAISLLFIILSIASAVVLIIL